MSVTDQMMFDLDPLPKKLRKGVFLEEMNQVVRWSALVALVQPNAREAHQALGGSPTSIMQLPLLRRPEQ